MSARGGPKPRRAIDRLMLKRRIDHARGCWLFTGYVLQTDNPRYPG